MNGSHFTYGQLQSVISEMVKIWPSLNILYGRPRHAKSSRSREAINMWKICLDQGCMTTVQQTGPWAVILYSFKRIVPITKDLLDEVENEDDLRMLEEEPIENNNLQKELHSDDENNNLNNVVLMEEIEDPHGMGKWLMVTRMLSGLLLNRLLRIKKNCVSLLNEPTNPAHRSQHIFGIRWGHHIFGAQLRGRRDQQEVWRKRHSVAVLLGLSLPDRQTRREEREQSTGRSI
nr:unnamed protein product [Callosobruchus analis]